jgi:Ser/Thr protein kinase RdoA (MazF antagonist)
VIEAGRVVFAPRPSRVTASLSARFGPPEIDASTVLEVLGRYGLGGTRPARNLRLARRSHNVVIETGHGRKVLKLYRKGWRTETVTYVHSILDRLATIGVPAPRLERTHDDEDQVPTELGAIAALFDWIPGRNYSVGYLRRADRLRLTAMAGETLAGLHTSLIGFEPQGEHHMGFVSLTGARRRDVAWHTATVEELIDRSRRISDDEATGPAASLVAGAPALLEEIAALEVALAGTSFPRLVIHGDYGLHNLLFSPTGPAVPVDFELSRIDWRVNDLISVVGKHRYTDGSYDREAMETLVRAYARTFPLTDEERRALPDAWRLYKLQAAVQYWKSYFDTSGPVRKLASSLDSIEQARWPSSEPATFAGLADAGASLDPLPGHVRTR